MNQSKSKLISQLFSGFKKYINIVTVKPFLETYKTAAISLDLINVDLLFQGLPKLIFKKAQTLDTELLKSLSTPEIQTRLSVYKKVMESDELSDEALKYMQSDNSRQYLFSYLSSLGRSIIVTIYSTSYISSLILMRSFFELLIGITTIKTGSFKDTIESISFLTEDEKNQLKLLWKNLCSWSHPYGKWIKEICPLYELNTPKFNEKLFKICFENLMSLLDFLIVIVIEKYEINPKVFVEHIYNPFKTGLKLKSSLPNSKKRFKNIGI
jgi:hypothetical protein